MLRNQIPLEQASQVEKDTYLQSIEKRINSLLQSVSITAVTEDDYLIWIASGKTMLLQSTTWDYPDTDFNNIRIMVVKYNIATIPYDSKMDINDNERSVTLQTFKTYRINLLKSILQAPVVKWDNYIQFSVTLDYINNLKPITKAQSTAKAHKFLSIGGSFAENNTSLPAQNYAQLPPYSFSFTPAQTDCALHHGLLCARINKHIQSFPNSALTQNNFNQNNLILTDWAKIEKKSESIMVIKDLDLGVTLPCTLEESNLAEVSSLTIKTFKQYRMNLIRNIQDSTTFTLTNHIDLKTLRSLNLDSKSQSNAQRERYSNKDSSTRDVYVQANDSTYYQNSMVTTEQPNKRARVFEDVNAFPFSSHTDPEDNKQVYAHVDEKILDKDFIWATFFGNGTDTSDGKSDENINVLTSSK